MVVDDLEIREAALDPIGDARKYLISVLVAVADHRARENRGLMRILMFKLSRGDVVIPMKCCQERLKPTALLLQR
jgi:hypothetical protein